MNKLTDKNRLSITHPKLCTEWYYEKNYPLKPEEVSYGMSLKAWWVCRKDKNHQWITSINARSCGNGCPYCSGKRVSNSNRLSLINPEICKIWDYKRNKLTPNDFSYGSTAKVNFICSQGHKWRSIIQRTTGCPYCANQIVNKENSFKSNYPKLMKEWDYERNTILPENIAGKSSNRNIHWICKHNHRWQDTISHRTRDRNCPYCSGHRVSKEKCLAITNPKLAMEWHPTKNGKLTPYDVLPNSNKKVWWQCNEEHEWKTAVTNRNIGGTGCPKCIKVKLKDGSYFDSLVEAYLYLRLKGKGFEIEQRRPYGIGKSRCDFYLPKVNTYIEVTGFNKKMSGHKYGTWKEYYKKIKRKRKYVKSVLGAKFRFIQINLNNKQKLYIRKNSI